MEKEFSIRIGQESDIDKIIVLWEGLMRFHENCVSDFVLNKDAKQKMIAYLQSFFNSKEKTVFVAEQSNEIVGYIFGLVKKKPPVFEENVVGEIGDTFVREDMRRKGIGEALVETVLEWIKQKGLKSVELNMYPENKVAAVFWDKMGLKSYFLTRRKNIA